MKTIDRRTFLRDGALGLAALSAAAKLEQPGMADPLGLPIGLQLYTVRDQMAMDFDGTLKQVAAIGYKEVEMANFYNKKPMEIRDSLRAAGLSCPSAHYLLPQLRNGLDQRIEDAKQLGLGYMVCAFLMPAERKTLDDYLHIAELFNHIGEQCHNSGIQFAYHGHNFEFTPFGRVLPYDVLLSHTDPRLVKFEMDCYWVSRAGKDPVTYLKKYPGRFPLLHIKDMKPGHAPTSDISVGGDAFTEVGRGVIDWKRIFKAAHGLKHYFVEQDKCDRPPLESAKISYDYLHSLQA